MDLLVPSDCRLEEHRHTDGGRRTLQPLSRQGTLQGTADLGQSVDYRNGSSATAGTSSWYTRCFNVSEVQDTNDTRDVPCDEWDYDPTTAERSAAAGSPLPGHSGPGLVRDVEARGQAYGHRLALKQVIFLAPTALLLPALLTVRESPRWLVAKGRLDEAEAVMMEAAKVNNFPLALTACLVEKLREHMHNRLYREYADREDDLPRRSFLAATSYNEVWIACFTVAVALLTYAVMHFLITGVPLVMVLSACFLLAGCIQCALSVAVGTGSGMATKILLVLSKGVSDVILVHCFTYVLELFPSAVRARCRLLGLRLRSRCGYVRCGDPLPEGRSDTKTWSSP
ncbi:hypothetical protein HPB52_016303 [Rhipicephalus sanguineus]|uniref:Sugar transporter n=1 Tax=Rhipicephalus sanguineus TaxID=34632 RepID=A0A9D4SQZ9_RHISA|nr:hypothetical protein HPB52_016303 [Rhipicephalus sanguineus]